MRHVLRRRGTNIGREHTARLMRSAGLSRKDKGGPNLSLGPRLTRCTHQQRLAHDARNLA
ncbi:TPA: hypothetical protein I8V36_002320 [Corynebacterium striatum]|nr:hypothetical protein [Corynebacterium striatum]HAT1177273.1 hypothetical protein [Corynebacterium striatum]HAT1450291.1 hypothetical protein [Corynebacterium striatum]